MKHLPVRAIKSYCELSMSTFKRAGALNGALMTALSAAILASFYCQLIALAADSSDLVKSAVQADDIHDSKRAQLLYKSALKSKLSAPDECLVSARLATLLVRAGRLLDAQAHTDRAISIGRELKKQGNLQHQVAIALTWLRDAYTASLNAEMEVVAGQGVVFDQTARDQLALIELVEGKVKLAEAHSVLALVQTENNHFKEAEVTYGQAISDLQGTDPNSGYLLDLRLRRALIQKKIGKVKEGSETIDKIKHDLSKTKSEAAILDEIGTSQHWIQDRDAAIETYNLSLQKINKHLAGDRAVEADVTMKLAILYRRLNQLGRSEEYFKRVVQTLSLPGADRRNLLIALKELAAVLRKDKKNAEADKVVSQAKRLNGQITRDSGKWLADEEREASQNLDNGK